MTIQELQELHKIIDEKFNGKEKFKIVDLENALEKQTPKKLKGTEVARFGFEFICPNCEEVIAMVWDSIWQKGLFKQNYCQNCGQALDWEDVK